MKVRIASFMQFFVCAKMLILVQSSYILVKLYQKMVKFLHFTDIGIHTNYNSVVQFVESTVFCTGPGRNYCI